MCKKVRDLVDVHHLVVVRVVVGVSGVDIVGRRALPSRELTDEISMLRHDVPQANRADSAIRCRFCTCI